MRKALFLTSLVLCLSPHTQAQGYNPHVPDMIRAGVRKALDLAPPSAPPAQPNAAGRP
ncbi:MAG: hypothetical protein ACJ74T_23710 [Pyrinomonadaceae bacterium]